MTVIIPNEMGEKMSVVFGKFTLSEERREGVVSICLFARALSLGRHLSYAQNKQWNFGGKISFYSFRIG